MIQKWATVICCAALLWTQGCADPVEPDAAVTDASADAGPGRDGAFADAEPIDAAPIDAEVLDAAPLDAEIVDATDLDAGFDAGTFDAGDDAGAPDSGPPPFRTAFQVVTASDTSCALFEDGQVKCWGSLRTTPASTFGRTPGTMGVNLPYLDLGAGARVVRLFSGQNGICGTLETGALRCFGDNTYRQLGFVGSGALSSATVPPPVDLGPTRTATAVSMGWTHTCALLDDRSVVCFGAGGVGETGQGMTGTSSTPRPVDLGAGRTAKAIDADGYFGCAILDNDALKCWGANGNSSSDTSLIGGQLGTGDTRARGNEPNEMGDNLLEIDLGTNPATTQRWQVKAVSTGITRTCALLENDRLKCFGRNDGAPDVLGTGDNVSWGSAANLIGDAMPFIDLGVDPLTTQPWRVKKIAVGDTMTCALLANDRLKCWGAGALGSTGTGSNVRLGDMPSEMGDALPFLDLGTNPATNQPWRVLQITCGKNHSCAVLEGNRVKCWGYNNLGQLGLEDNQNRGDNPDEMGDLLPLVQLQ